MRPSSLNNQGRHISSEKADPVSGLKRNVQLPFKRVFVNLLVSHPVCHCTASCQQFGIEENIIDFIKRDSNTG